MPWTTPRTWTVGLQATKALLDTHIRDNIAFLGTHGHSGAAGDGTQTLDSLGRIDFTQTASPTSTGQLTRDGTELGYSQAGVTVFIVTQRDGLAGTATLRSLGTTGTTAAAGNHGHGASWVVT